MKISHYSKKVTSPKSITMSAADMYEYITGGDNSDNLCIYDTYAIWVDDDNEYTSTSMTFNKKTGTLVITFDNPFTKE